MAGNLAEWGTWPGISGFWQNHHHDHHLGFGVYDSLEDATTMQSYSASLTSLPDKSTFVCHFYSDRRRFAPSR